MKGDNVPVIVDPGEYDGDIVDGKTISIDEVMKILRKEHKHDDVEEKLQNIEDDDKFEVFIRNAHAKRAKLKNGKKATLDKVEGSNDEIDLGGIEL